MQENRSPNSISNPRDGRSTSKSPIPSHSPTYDPHNDAPIDSRQLREERSRIEHEAQQDQS